MESLRFILLCSTTILIQVRADEPIKLDTSVGIELNYVKTLPEIIIPSISIEKAHYTVPHYHHHGVYYHHYHPLRHLSVSFGPHKRHAPPFDHIDHQFGEKERKGRNQHDIKREHHQTREEIHQTREDIHPKRPEHQHGGAFQFEIKPEHSTEIPKRGEVKIAIEVVKQWQQDREKMKLQQDGQLNMEHNPKREEHQHGGAFQFAIKPEHSIKEIPRMSEVKIATDVARRGQHKHQQMELHQDGQYHMEHKMEHHQKEHHKMEQHQQGFGFHHDTQKVRQLKPQAPVDEQIIKVSKEELQRQQEEDQFAEAELLDDGNFGLKEPIEMNKDDMPQRTEANNNKRRLSYI